MISLKNISKTYRAGTIPVHALQDITLEVKAGELVAIMGPSGSGKSTLMNILGCLDTPTDGSYKLDNVEISGLDDTGLARIRNQKIGFVFQNFNLLPRMSAQRNVELPMIYAGMDAKVREERALAALKRVGLAERVHHKPNELSGGQNQRVAIARALVNQPAVILADEPTGALDSTSGEEIMSIFQALNSEGTTIVLVTHEADIAQHAKRVLHFRDGMMMRDEKISQPFIAKQLLDQKQVGR